MKKSLIAVAVAAALPTIALAQTNVTLYGIADGGIGMQDRGGNAKSAIVVSSGTQSTSRFGIRGTEDLGGGMKATFNFESGIRADTGLGSPSNAGLDFSRRSVVGLEGSFGSVLLGRDYTPGFSAGGATDVMGYGLYGNYLGYTVVSFDRPSKALEYFRSSLHSVDLVIMDMVMPEMTSGDCLSAFQEINGEVKLILSSGYGLNTQAQELIDAGAVAMIQKPFHVAQLSELIAKILGRSSSEEPKLSHP